MAMKQEHPSQRNRSLSDLHESLLHLILARVGVYSLPTCAQVCKTWSLIITRSLSFARLHASLHSSHTWFTLFNLPSLHFYDTLAQRFASTPCLDLVDEPPSIDTDTARITSEQQRKILQQLRHTLFDEELLATSEGLVLSRSEYSNDLIVTNIVTRKKKLLPSPNPQLRHIAFAGMAYIWANMSYQVLLCGLPQTLNPQGRFFTCIYNSLTQCWTNANSTLGAEVLPRLPVKRFARPQTCVWLGGHFYCVMGRALYFFNLETMEWDSVYSLPPHKGPIQPHNRVQVQLPTELIQFYCFWEHKGELRIAGSLKIGESKFVTQVWCYSPSLQTGCGVFRWQNFACLPPITIHTDNGPRMISTLISTFGGSDWYASGDTLCLCIISRRSYVRYGCILRTSKLHFCVHDLAKGDVKIVKSILSMDIYRDVSPLAHLAIQPCPFTSP